MTNYKEKTVYTDNPEKLMGQKDMKQKWKGPKSFDICFPVIFRWCDQSLILGRDTED